MMHPDNPARPRNRNALPPFRWGILFGLLVAVPINASAACTIEYSDGLIQALSQASGQYVPRYHGNFSSLQECQAVLNDAVIKSGDPTLRMNMKCVGCSNTPQQGQSSPPATNAAAQAAKKKLEAQQKAEQQQFLRDKESLSQQLKGVTPSTSSALTLKPAPPPDTARRQLDCILHDSRKSEIDDRLPPGGDWQNPGDCIPSDPAVPPVPAGAATPTDEDGAQEFLAGIVRQLTATRQQLKQQDQEIERLEQDLAQELAQEEAHKPLTGLKEAPKESDALKRAREALARARAARQQTAEQLRRLEQQEKAAPPRQ